MNKNQIAKKYSRALMNNTDIADIPVILRELKAFSELIDADRKLRLVFAGQIFSDEEKEKAFAAAAPSLKFHPGSQKLLKLMINQGHLPAMRETLAASIALYNERQKKETAQVMAPVPLTKAFTERIRKALMRLTEREIEIEQHIDPSLVGGIIVRIGSTIYDSSIRGQLKLLRTELMR